MLYNRRSNDIFDFNSSFFFIKKKQKQVHSFRDNGRTRDPE